ADEDGGLVAPDGVRRREAAAQVAGVDDVVVQQRRRMNEFDGGGERDMARHRPVAAAIAAEPRRRQGQHRPQPLAARRDDVPGKLRDEGDGAMHALEDEGIDGAEIRAQQLDERIEARRPLPLDLLLRSGNQRQMPLPYRSAADRAPSALDPGSSYSEHRRVAIRVKPAKGTIVGSGA